MRDNGGLSGYTIAVAVYFPCHEAPAVNVKTAAFAALSVFALSFAANEASAFSITDFSRGHPAQQNPNSLMPGAATNLSRDSSGRIVIAEYRPTQVAADIFSSQLPENTKKSRFFSAQELATLTPDKITYAEYGAFRPLAGVLPVDMDLMANRRPATALRTPADMETFVAGGSRIATSAIDPKKITGESFPRIMDAVTDYEKRPWVLSWRVDAQGRPVFDTTNQQQLVPLAGMDAAATKHMTDMEVVRRDNVYPFTDPLPGKEVPASYLDARAAELRDVVAKIPPKIQSPWLIGRAASGLLGLRWQSERDKRMGLKHFNGKVEIDPETGVTVYRPTENAANAYTQAAEILRAIGASDSRLLQGVILYDSTITVAGVAKKVTYAYVPPGPGRQYLSQLLDIKPEFWKHADDALRDSGVARANEQIEGNPAIKQFVAAQTPKTVGWAKDLEAGIERQLQQRIELFDAGMKPGISKADILRIWAVTQEIGKINVADRTLAGRLAQQTETSLKMKYDLNKAFGWGNPFGYLRQLDGRGLQETLVKSKSVDDEVRVQE